jgi:signal transduction histidine kinase
MSKRGRKVQHGGGLAVRAQPASGSTAPSPAPDAAAEGNAVASLRPAVPPAVASASAPAQAPAPAATPALVPFPAPARATAPAPVDGPEIERLRTELAELKRVNRLKDQYMSFAAHELSTPLTAIKAYIEALVEHHGDPEFQQGPEFLRVLQRETARLIRVVDRTLQISRLTGRAQNVRRSDVDLQQLVDETADSMRPVLAERAVHLEVHVPDALPNIAADRDLLEQVLINLVDNAAKFSPRGRTVTLRATARADGVEIEVRDQGYGIASDELGRIFDPYFRSDDGRVTCERGIGLGLAIVKTIVEQHGGRVSVESQLDSGTTFRFRLPRV